MIELEREHLRQIYKRHASDDQITMESHKAPQPFLISELFFLVPDKDISRSQRE